MIVSAEDHLDWILRGIPLLSPERRGTREAFGLTLAEDVRAANDLPLWDNSAMDGYAVRSADLAEASEESPIELVIVGEVPAGSAEDPELAPGAAIRIMTGAPLPTATDAVVRVEDTSPESGARGSWADGRVTVHVAPAPGANVRRRGEDTEAGATIAVAGEALGAQRLAALAAAGVAEVSVRRRPRVAVIATGSELAAPGSPLRRGQIPESNSVLLAGLVEAAGAGLVSVEVSADDAEAFAARIAGLAETCDVIVTSGGVGPGRHDIVRIALADEPGVRAVRVAVRPGQPQCVGALRSGAWIFALPGNPVSAAVSFELFVRPALLRAQGRTRLERLRVPARAESGWRGVAGRLQVLPVRISETPDGLSCRPAVNPRGVSHAVGGHGGADGYALVEAERGDVTAGENVSVILVDA